GDQLFLPRLALPLPGAKADEKRERNHRRDSQRHQAFASGCLLHQLIPPGSNRPCSALFLYCRAISVAFMGLSRPKPRMKATGAHSTACIQSGGDNLNSTRRAAPINRKPRMMMTKTAGPSPLSAKSLPSPQTS